MHGTIGDFQFFHTFSRFMMDTTHSSRSTGVDKKSLGDSLEWPAGKSFRLRILVDRSVVEAFAGKRAAIAGRFYPTIPSSAGVAVVAEGGTAILCSLEAWQMKSIW